MGRGMRYWEREVEWAGDERLGERGNEQGDERLGERGNGQGDERLGEIGRERAEWLEG